MEERDFFDEKQGEETGFCWNCPHCHQAADYEVTWVVRTKKRQLGGRADEAGLAPALPSSGRIWSEKMT